MDQETLSTARQMLAMALEKLEAAKQLNQTGYCNDSLSRSYYAAFHAVGLILFLHGMAFSRHGQLIGAFNRKFIATAKFEKEIGKALSRLFDQRQIADYDCFEKASEEEAAKAIADATMIIEGIVRYCEREFSIDLK